jgi:uncharacterized cofD-like protein
MIKSFLRRYSLPGMKRWILFIILGILFIAFGVALILKAHPLTRIFNWIWMVFSFIADHVPPTVSGIIAVSLGAFALIYAFFSANKRVMNLVAPDESSLIEALDRHHMKGKGLKIVVIGGGTGLSNMLRGLKNYTSNITAIVTVADDGGSSGRLRQSMNIVPPGDIRNCIAALAYDDEVITKLFQYRFDEDAAEDLRNHSFGNLFLTALVELGGTKNMADAVKQACRILKARGQVLPVSNTPMCLIAELADGQIIKGESQIPKANSTVKKLDCEKPVPEILPDVLDAVETSDLIVIGPGSLYTSIIPNLLVPELANAVYKAKAKKIYVCNMMTQPGETVGYTVSDHIEAIYNHLPKSIDPYRFIDFVIANDAAPRKKQLEKYKADGQFPVQIDEVNIRKLEVKLIPTRLVQRGNLVRHNPYKLAKTIMDIYEKYSNASN